MLMLGIFFLRGGYTSRELLLGTLYVLKVALPSLLLSLAELGAFCDDLFMVELGAIEPSALRRELVLVLDFPPRVFEDRVIPPGLLDGLDMPLPRFVWDDMVLPRFVWADFDFDMHMPVLALDPPRVLEDRLVPPGLLDDLLDMPLARFVWADVDFDMDMPLPPDPSKIKRDIMAADGF